MWHWVPVDEITGNYYVAIERLKTYKLGVFDFRIYYQHICVTTFYDEFSVNQQDLLLSACRAVNYCDTFEDSEG